MTTRPSGNTLCVRSETVKPLRVYLRQSKEEQFQKESIPTQRAECERLVAALGLAAAWRDRIEYVDVDRAGDDAGREQLQRLVRESQAGDVVVAWKQDRVGRDMIDSAATIRELVKYRQAKLYTAETGTAAVTLDSAEQTAMVMLRGMVAQGELERIRSRTRDGLRQRARDGFATGRMPFGFRSIPVDPIAAAKNPKLSKKRIEIDEPQAAIVRRIFDEYLHGNGYLRIANGLNRDGIVSPRGQAWSRSAIWDLLRNRVYVGEWAHGRRKTVRREGDRKIMAKAHETEVLRTVRPQLAIVAPDVWERVQARLTDRWTDMKTQCATPSRHALSSTLRCDQCDNLMRIKITHGRRADWKRRYYVCSRHVRTHTCANAVHIPADEAEATIGEYIRTKVFDEIADKVRASIRAQIDASAERLKNARQDVERLTEELESLRRERQRLVRLAAVTDEPIPEVIAALKENQARATAHERAVSIAKRPPIDGPLAERLEANAVEQVQKMRERLASSALREATRALFPKGLRFKIKNGLWLIEGAASVPGVGHPDA